MRWCDDLVGFVLIAAACRSTDAGEPHRGAAPAEAALAASKALRPQWFK